MRILSFDQSVTGSAAVVGHGDLATGLVTITDQEINKPEGNGIPRMIGIRSWIDAMLFKYPSDFLIREMHNQRTYGAGSQIHVVGGLIDMFAWDQDFVLNNRYAIVPVTSWKKFCLGKGNVAKDTAYLVKCNKFFNESKFVKVDLGEDVVMNDNIADAICLAVYAFAAYCLRCKEAPTDRFKQYQTDALKKADVIFDYGKMN